MVRPAARLATVLLSATLTVGTAYAMWAKLTDQELVDRSDLIVTGVLAEERRMGSGASEVRVGVIRIDEVLKGDQTAEALLALPDASRPISSSDIAFRIGQSGLWYLRAQKSGDRTIYLADHPQRFVPVESARPKVDALRAARRR